MSVEYFYGRGQVWLADRDATTGEAKNLVKFEEISELELTFDVTFVEHKNKSKALSVTDLKIVNELNGSGKLVVDQSNAELLAACVYGSVVTETGGAFSAQAFPTGIVAGEFHRLPGNRANVSSLVITDSAGTPATLTAGTHYKADTKAGIVEFINLGSFVQPFKAAGTEAAGQKSIVMLNQRSQEKYLIFDGFNLANGDKHVLVDLYRISVSPTKSLSLMSTGNEPRKLELELGFLADSTKADDAQFGRYGRIRNIE